MSLALGDDADAVGHLLGLLDVVRRQDDGDAGVAQARARPPTCPCAARRRRRLSARRGTGSSARAPAPWRSAARRFMPPDSVMILLSFLSHSDSCLQHLLDVGRVGRLAEQAAAEADGRPTRSRTRRWSAPAARGRSSRARAVIGAMSWPSTVTVPDVALTMPQMMLISVVLPAPLGPSSANISPRRMSRLMSSAP